jgi:hypothetical protein
MHRPKKKAAFMRIVDAGETPGLLAYRDGEPEVLRRSATRPIMRFVVGGDSR